MLPGLSIASLAEMGDLSQLPFPPSELSWDKLPVVMKHLGLSKVQAATVVQLVLGAPSVFWQYIQSNISKGFSFGCFGKGVRLFGRDTNNWLQQTFKHRRVK